jgi:hypothetical protein
MLSCKDVSEAEDRQLSLRERVGLNAHFLMCRACRQVARQIALLGAAARHINATVSGASDPTQSTLPQEARVRILEQVRRAGADPGNDTDQP